MDIMVYMKNQNAKIYRNTNGNPYETLRVEKIEATLWAKAQINESKNPRDVYLAE